MENIKQKLLQLISKVNDVEQAKTLNSIVYPTFEYLTEYTDTMYNFLEKKLLSSLRKSAVKENYFSVFSTIVEKQSLKLYLDDFQPVIPVKESETDLKESLISNKKCIVEEFFIKLPYPEIEKVADKEIKGYISNGTEKLEIIFRFERNEEYIKREIKLFEIFDQNRMNWNSLNNPYSRKFFNLIAYIADEDISKIEKYSSITSKDFSFNLEEYKDVALKNHVLIWNIMEKEYANSYGVKPTHDNIYFESTIELDEEDRKLGILVDSTNLDGKILEIYRNKDNDLNVVLNFQKVKKWKLLVFKPIDLFKFKSLAFKITSNNRVEDLINGVIKEYGSKVRTIGEIRRVVKSFADENLIHIKNQEFEVEITDNTSSKNYITYNVNDILLDGFHNLKIDRKIMVLRFKSGNENFMTNDLLSFVVSEIQCIFPEYLCKGEIVQ